MSKVHTLARTYIRYTNTYTYIAHPYTRTYKMFIYACTCTCTPVIIYTPMYTCARIHIRTYACTHTQVIILIIYYVVICYYR